MDECPKKKASAKNQSDKKLHDTLNDLNSLLQQVSTPVTANPLTTLIPQHIALSQQNLELKAQIEMFKKKLHKAPDDTTSNPIQLEESRSSSISKSP